jgi:hypothetical protein
VFIYGVNEHKKGQFEPTGLGKLIEKQFRSGFWNNRIDSQLNY